MAKGWEWEGGGSEGRGGCGIARGGGWPFRPVSRAREQGLSSKSEDPKLGRRSAAHQTRCARSGLEPLRVVAVSPQRQRLVNTSRALRSRSIALARATTAHAEGDGGRGQPGGLAATSYALRQASCKMGSHGELGGGGALGARAGGSGDGLLFPPRKFASPLAEVARPPSSCLLQEVCCPNKASPPGASLCKPFVSHSGRLVPGFSSWCPRALVRQAARSLWMRGSTAGCRGAARSTRVRGP